MRKILWPATLQQPLRLSLHLRPLLYPHLRHRFLHLHLPLLKYPRFKQKVLAQAEALLKILPNPGNAWVLLLFNSKKTILLSHHARVWLVRQ